ncbi:receptor-like protein kinase [Populus alba x Populus x berolinensis]|uniref:non-specific serine/threonine protein kinase n=1 Tax=Populus alba x Populus x berolinensis TaxID=444605 RepID=A0AAD6W9X6_9ROSI|nr:receptor-like protein kinase [Populus alba x Populus x berolinensis]
MPSRPLSPSFDHPRPSFLTKTRILFLTLTISASVVLILTILYFVYHLWCTLVNRSRTIPFDSSAPLKLQRFSYKELKIATNDFDDANIIGKGGSATVFRGIARDGKLYAIKRLDALSLQSEREFQNELQILGGLRSPFLVILLGYCVEKNKRLLVYEYVPNKSLQELLFGDGHLSLCWERRFNIILDVAKALEFLHLGCDPPVIHGDVKPSNVLLDFDMRAKISDFGLSRIKVEGEFGVDLFSMRGTLCYVAPEYGGCGYLMEKADIYSLGVLILVIVSGRRPLHVLASPMKLEKANLISWCRQLAQTGNILELVDERMKDEHNKEQASLCINLALTCLQRMPELRPDIGEIVKILKGEMDLPHLPFEFSPSPPSKLFSRSRRKQKSNAE